MGQSCSCHVPGNEQDLFAAVQSGEIKVVESIIQLEPGILRRSTLYRDFSVVHIAAANGHPEVFLSAFSNMLHLSCSDLPLCFQMLSMLLERWAHPDVLSRQKQTPLMLATMRGNIACVEKLLCAGANILTFDSVHGRTCLHYAAYYGHSDCLQSILQTAQTNLISASWGFARFVNVKDTKGETPLHLAARQGRLACIRVLLDQGALVSASSGYNGFRGNTPLHFAAREGSLECVRELLARGADRRLMDSAGRTAFDIASRRNHLCAALLNPSSVEPLVWPSPLKFISELNPDVKLLLEKALIEANRKREKNILKGMVYALSSPTHSESVDDDKLELQCNSIDLCCICFEQACTIEVQDCGHQMCAHCTMALCCHNKPKHDTRCPPAPACPFCRSNIARLTVAKSKIKEEIDTKFPQPKEINTFSKLQ